MGKYFCFFISVCLFPGFSTATKADIDDQFSKQRQLYVKAENALKRRQIDNYRRYLKKIPDYPLVPYLLYRDFRYHLGKATNQQVLSFLERYPNTPKSDKLRVRWLKSLWKQKDYPNFLKFYKSGLSRKLQCYQLQIRIKNDTVDQIAIDQINDLWLYHKSRPEACNSVFAYWTEKGYRTNQLVWQRTALAMTKGVPSIVRYLKDLLPADERYLADLWFELRTHPARIVDRAKKAQRSPKESVVFAYAIRRFTWRKSEKALIAWQQIKNSRAFSGSQKTAIWKALTLNLADKVGQPKLDWINELAESELTSELRVLRIRHALATLKWRQAQVWLDKLPQQEAKLMEWKYWRARSLAQLGENTKALEIYKQLAGLRNFYGFLSAAQLGEAGQIRHQPLKIDNASLNKARNLPMVRRAKEFYLMKRLVEARREWRQLTNTVGDKQLLAAAAQVASDWGWHNQAIIALAKARMYDDVSIRYPLAHREAMIKYSRLMNIPTAWPFAIARQESTFSTDIRSDAGALGLMQLLPSTAKSLARKLKAKKPNSYQLIQPATNIKFGTAYLKRLLNSFNGNLVLAVASYNAGPTKVRRWVSKLAVPEDVWVELIPYRETARYVKSVLSNQFIYNRQLGQTDGVFAQMPNQSIGKAKGVVKKHNVSPSQTL